MTPSARHLLQAAAALPAAAAVLCLFLAVRSGAPESSVPGARSAPAEASALTGGGHVPGSGAGGSALGESAAAALRAAMAPAPSAGGALAKRFRLAGTVLGTRPGESLAIIDDRSLVRQLVVSPGEEIAEGVALVSVSERSAVLSGESGEETLELEKSAPAPDAARRRGPSAPAEIGAGRGPSDAPAAPRTPREVAAERFGGREVFPGRWAYDRGKVVEYYEELRAQPERLLAIFDTMDPVWGANEDGSRRIDGYRVDVKGESDFFLAAGLEEGDVVLGVNSAPMNDRRRAEALIASFIEGRATTFVFEIERAGRRVKQVVEIE